MIVDGTRTDPTATGQRDAGPTCAGNQRSQHERRRAHGLHQFIRRFRRHDRWRPQGDGFALHVDVGADIHEKTLHSANVADAGDAAQHNLISRQEGGGEYGERGILRSAGGDEANERCSALDDELVHIFDSTELPGAGRLWEGECNVNSAGWSPALVLAAGGVDDYVLLSGNCVGDGGGVGGEGQGCFPQ